MVIVPIEFSPAFSFKQKSVLGNKKLRNPEIAEFFCLSVLRPVFRLF